MKSMHAGWMHRTNLATLRTDMQLLRPVSSRHMHWSHELESQAQALSLLQPTDL
jgi:hypothetical protein